MNVVSLKAITFGSPEEGGVAGAAVPEGRGAGGRQGGGAGAPPLSTLREVFRQPHRMSAAMDRQER